MWKCASPPGSPYIKICWAYFCNVLHFSISLRALWSGYLLFHESVKFLPCQHHVEVKWKHRGSWECHQTVQSISTMQNRLNIPFCWVFQGGPWSQYIYIYIENEVREWSEWERSDYKSALWPSWLQFIELSFITGLNQYGLRSLSTSIRSERKTQRNVLVKEFMSFCKQTIFFEAMGEGRWMEPTQSKDAPMRLCHGIHPWYFPFRHMFRTLGGQWLIINI